MSKKALIAVALIFIVTTITLAFKIHKNDQALANLEHNLEEYKVLAPEISFPLIENSRENQENKENLSKTIIVSHFSLDNNFIHNVMENHQQYAKKHGYDYWFRNGIIDSKLIDLSQKKHRKRYMLCWQKLAAVKQAMEINDGGKPKYEWVMWIDGDAVFTDVTKSLETLRTDINVSDKDYFIIARDMICTKDHITNHPEACYNSGVFLIRNNYSGQKFIEDIIKSFPYYKNNKLPDQSAINYYVFGEFKKDLIKIKHKYIKRLYKCPIHNHPRVKVVASKVMNSGLKKRDCKGNKNINLWKPGDFILHFTGLKSKIRDQKINAFLTCMANHPNDLNKCELN